MGFGSSLPLGTQGSAGLEQSVLGAPSARTCLSSGDSSGVRVTGEAVWAHRTTSLRGLDFGFAVRCTDAHVGHYLEAVLSPLRSSVPASHWYSLVNASGGRVDLYLDRSRVGRFVDTRTAVGWLMWDINRAVLDASSEHLLFHAGGVQLGDSGVLLPAPSGSGKSTLVAALVRAGLGYLSDELVAITTRTGRLLPYPKPLTVKVGSFEALGELRPTSVFELAGRAGLAGLAGDEWHLPPDGIRQGGTSRECEPRFVVVPRYVRDGVTALRRMEPATAFLALATNTVNFSSHGPRAAQLVGELVERCDCYELEMSDLDESCKLLLALAE